MPDNKTTQVLFVCMGNICRSPTAQGVFQAMVDAAGLDRCIAADSAGTHAYHVGKPPDRRAQRAAGQRGYDLSGQRARQVVPADFDRFDWLIAMDAQNYRALIAGGGPRSAHKVRKLLRFLPEAGVEDVPDPYYGGDQGFERVLDLVEAASRGLLAFLRERGGVSAAR